MIKITIELVSAVDPKRNRVLGTMQITNDGTGTDESGNYTGKLNAEWRNRIPARKGNVLSSIQNQRDSSR